MTYAAKGGSVASRVIQFFRENPDETLSAADVAIKFDTPVDHVFNRLRGAVDAGVLIKRPGPVAGRVVYCSARNPLLGHASSVFDMGDKAKRRARKASSFDPSTVIVRDNVPLPPKRSGASTLSAQLAGALEGMSVGQMCELPRGVRGTAAKVITGLNKTGAHYELRALGDDKIGVWRTA